jgi:predicted enzyme related to lactoylglutathione lyase
MDCRIGYVTVGISDLERSIAFYRDVMGFKLLYSAPEFHYASFDANGMRFSIAGGGSDEHSAGRRTGIGFVVPDVDAAHAELVAKGVEFTMPPGKQPWGGYMGMFADPDGNIFYLDSSA